jgi:hypothetical protein
MLTIIQTMSHTMTLNNYITNHTLHDLYNPNIVSYHEFKSLHPKTYITNLLKGTLCLRNEYIFPFIGKGKHEFHSVLTIVLEHIRSLSPEKSGC